MDRWSMIGRAKLSVRYADGFALAFEEESTLGFSRYFFGDIGGAIWN